MPQRAEPRRAEPPRAPERPRAAERQQRTLEQQRRADEQRRGLEQRRAAEQQRTRERAQAQEQRRAAERQRATERQRTEQSQRAYRPPGAGERAGQGERRAAEKQPENRRAQREQMRQAREQLSPDQRTRLRSAFRTEDRARISKARFRARIGTHVPRTVALFAIPAAVYEIFPYYRDYRYVVLDDTICIVETATYEIVDVIDQGYFAPGTRPQTAELSLSEAERLTVLDGIPPNFPQADLRLRLALGAEIPEDVELYEFAPIVLDNVPKLRDYRFLVSQGQVVIVNPRHHSIALVLDR
jgi:hypothetical protein